MNLWELHGGRPAGVASVEEKRRLRFVEDSEPNRRKSQHVSWKAASNDPSTAERQIDHDLHFLIIRESWKGWKHQIPRETTK